MLKNFLEDYTEDRVETFQFVILSIFTAGFFTVYWLGKINKNYKNKTKSLLVSNGLIISFGIFAFIEGLFLGMAVGSGLEGNLQDLDMFNTIKILQFNVSFCQIQRASKRNEII